MALGDRKSEPAAPDAARGISESAVLVQASLGRSRAL